MTRPGAGIAHGSGSVAPTHGFVGRQKELEDVSSLLVSGPDRMFTLVGPGGIGKTRLASEAVLRARDAGVRVFWAHLARQEAGADYESVEQEVAEAVITADFSGRDTFAALVDTLRSRAEQARVVLVLDNGEHVQKSALALVTRLHDAVPDVTIMATSHGPIGAPDERLIQVRPLSAAEALELFWMRAELTGRSWADRTEDDIAAAADICRHLSNNPLHIRLAASRLRVMALESLRRDLTGYGDDRRLRWRAANSPEQRHGSVVDVVGYMVNLCRPAEKTLFKRMSVFAAADESQAAASRDATEVGASLDAIAAVCCDDPQADDGDQAGLDAEKIESLLESLYDRSLVTIHISSSGQRYSQSETLRVYAFDQLRAEGEGEPARMARRHLYYYRDRLADAASRWCSPDERELVDWARSAWPNVMAALRTATVVPGEAAAGLKICHDLMVLRTPFVLGSIREMRRWTLKCLEASEAMEERPLDLETETRSMLAWLEVRSGGREAAALLARCVAACLTDPDSTDWRHHPEIDYGLPGILDLANGTAGFMRDRDPRAIVALERAVAKFHADDDPNELFALMFAALAAALLGSASQAHRIARLAVRRAEGAGAPPWATSWVLLGWAVTLIKHGDPHEATTVLRRTLSNQLTMHDQWGAMWSVLLRSWALGRLIIGDDPQRDRDIAIEIAHLVGGTATLRDHLGVDLTAMGTFADETDNATTRARKVLGEKTFDAEYARGAALNPHTGEVHQLALGTLTLDAARPWDSLTDTERNVARLVAEGYSNPQIAEMRNLSPRTIERHVAAIFRKLGIHNRTQVVGFVPDDAKQAGTEFIIE